MANRITSALGRLFDNRTRPEPVHFHIGNHGRAIVCHDLDCGSPALDPRDAHAVSRGRWPIQPG